MSNGSIRTCAAAVAASMLFSVSSASAMEVWDVEFDGTGDPGLQGWNKFNYSGSTFAEDYNLNVGAQSGWFTAQGNAGGHVNRDKLGDNFSKATGWTMEFKMVTQGNFDHTVDSWGGFSDTTTYINWNATVDAEGSDSITFWSGGTSTSPNQSAVIALEYGTFPYAEHTFRLVRQANSSTIEIYLNEDYASPAGVLTAFEPAGFDNNDLFFFTSVWSASYDFWHAHHGATVPEIPEPASLALLGLGGLAMLRRRNA